MLQGHWQHDAGLGLDPDIWADASMSWGIGIVVSDRWAAWQLIEGWKCKDHDIGWEELIALKLAILWVADQGYTDCEVTIHSDNTRVIGTFNKGWFCNSLRDVLIHQIASILVPFNMTILPTYVPSGTNRADPVSHGVLGPQSLHLSCTFKLPQELVPFLSHV